MAEAKYIEKSEATGNCMSLRVKVGNGLVDESTSITPVKAFWQSSKLEDGLCLRCVPYVAIDKIFGEWTCRICGRQTYREKPMKLHIEEKHIKPSHTCGKSDDFDVKSVKDSNNNESKTCNSQLEPMETDSIDVEADTDTEEVMEPINPLVGQHLPPEVQGKYAI